MKNVIILGGAPRSGTTVTHALICTSRFTNNYVAECMFMRPLFQSLIIGMDNEPGHIKHFFPNHEEFLRFSKGIIAQAFDVVWENLGKPDILALKDPRMTPMFPKLAPRFPEIKFIVVVRHPIDILRSRREVFHKMHPNQHFDIPQAVHVLKEWVSCSNFQGRENILFLKYEDLGDPQFLQKIMSFTGLDDLNPDKLWEGVAASSASNNPWHSPLYGQKIEISTRNSDVQFSDEILQRVKEITGELCNRYGYLID